MYRLEVSNVFTLINFNNWRLVVFDLEHETKQWGAPNDSEYKYKIVFFPMFFDLCWQQNLSTDHYFFCTVLLQNARVISPRQYLKRMSKPL